MKRAAIEILLIVLISLFLSLIYNAVSPTGLRILPKKAEVKKDVNRSLNFYGNICNRHNKQDCLSL
jgi:hypothetical protein